MHDTNSDTTELPILFEDQDLLVVQKPAGLHSVAGEGPSLTEKLSDLYPELALLEDAGLVQRLDFETFGVMLVAKNVTIQDALREQLLAGKIHKEYLALVEGRIEKPLEVHTLIGNRHRGSKGVSCFPLDTRHERHRLQEAKTVFTPLRNSGDTAVVKAFAPVARRHQVRAHAAHSGHPLVGDVLYGSTKTLDEFAQSAARFALCASKIQFQHPTSGRQIVVLALIPDYLRAP